MRLQYATYVFKVILVVIDKLACKSKNIYFQYIASKGDQAPTDAAGCM